MNIITEIKYAGIAALLLVWCANVSLAQMVPVPLPQRIDNSSLIIEGKVISKKSFWNSNHYNIYTSNIIEVYKVFKGALSASQVEIITQGGIVGNQMDKVSHSLQLEINDIGIFTCIPNDLTKENPNINPGFISFTTYAGKQGFIKYDLKEKSAVDVFYAYKDIKNIVYPAITNITKQEYRTVKNVNLYKQDK